MSLRSSFSFPLFKDMKSNPEIAGWQRRHRSDLPSVISARSLFVWETLSQITERLFVLKVGAARSKSPHHSTTRVLRKPLCRFFLQAHALTLRLWSPLIATVDMFLFKLAVVLLCWIACSSSAKKTKRQKRKEVVQLAAGASVANYYRVLLVTVCTTST